MITDFYPDFKQRLEELNMASYKRGCYDAIESLIDACNKMRGLGYTQLTMEELKEMLSVVLKSFENEAAKHQKNLTQVNDLQNTKD